MWDISDGRQLLCYILSILFERKKINFHIWEMNVQKKKTKIFQQFDENHQRCYNHVYWFIHSRCHLLQFILRIFCFSIKMLQRNISFEIGKIQLCLFWWSIFLFDYILGSAQKSKICKINLNHSFHRHYYDKSDRNKVSSAGKIDPSHQSIAFRFLFCWWDMAKRDNIHTHAISASHLTVVSCWNHQVY